MNIRTKINRFLPDQPCILCGSMNHQGIWCAACDHALPYLDTVRCPVCALPTPQGEICGHCLQHPPLFTHTQALFAYAHPVDKLIQAMKYGEQLSLAHHFAQKLAQLADLDALPNVLLAMPLHPNKLRERGFNQSLLLAQKLADKLHLDLWPHACQRVRDTPAQSTLPWAQRKKNVHQAFTCTTDMTGRHVALVDDVLTSGASLNALAAAIHARGAKTISVYVVARTLSHTDTAQLNHSTL